ncbi:MAG: 3-oxoacyl-ACP reductase [Ponticaulis sp.]|nr:3-oxoacyl-ACP reductase [Ponticaulis sp.]|tara:strand:+ start:27277 stop:28071 length:795 start_codon:yes stop_codon:yes gene_type:complete
MSLSLNTVFGLDGKIALVTGGGRGLGKSMAEGFLAAGAAKVYIASRDMEALEATAKELSPDGKCIPIRANLATVEGCKALAADFAKLEDKLHILVNNSGTAWGAPMKDFPEAGWDKTFQLNLKSPFYLTGELRELLKAAGTHEDPARVINTGSIAGEVATSLGAYPYGLSKGAIHQLTQMQALEFADDHITANAIAPGRFPSKMTEYVMNDEEAYAKEVQGIPLKRWGRDEDIAGTALFLAGASGAFITGAIIPVDGGSRLKRG